MLYIFNGFSVNGKKIFFEKIFWDNCGYFKMVDVCDLFLKWLLRGISWGGWINFD